MVSLAQKCFAGCLGSEHAGLTFDAEVAIEAAMLRNEANDGLGEMDVEVVANDIPPCVGGGAAQQGVEKTSKVLLGPGVADHPGDFADRDIETGDQGLRAVAAILEFAPLDLARLHRQPRRDALQRLNTGHLVDRDCPMTLVGARCGVVNLTDVGAFGIKGRIGFWRQPVTKAMRFKVGLFFKKRPTERCEMFETKPRRIASSAISRWLCSWHAIRPVDCGCARSRILASRSSRRGRGLR